MKKPTNSILLFSLLLAFCGLASSQSKAICYSYSEQKDEMSFLPLKSSSWAPRLQMDPAEFEEGLVGLAKSLGTLKTSEERSVPSISGTTTGISAVIGTSSASPLIRGGGPKPNPSTSSGALKTTEESDNEEADEDAQEEEFRPLTLEDFQSIIIEEPTAKRLIIKEEIIMVCSANPRTPGKNRSENLEILRTLKMMLPREIAEEELPQDGLELMQGKPLSSERLAAILQKVNQDLDDLETTSTATGYTGFTQSYLGKEAVHIMQEKYKAEAILKAMRENQNTQKALASAQAEADNNDNQDAHGSQTSTQLTATQRAALKEVQQYQKAAEKATTEATEAELRANVLKGKVQQGKLEETAANFTKEREAYEAVVEAWEVPLEGYRMAQEKAVRAGLDETELMPALYHAQVQSAVWRAHTYWVGAREADTAAKRGFLSDTLLENTYQAWGKAKEAYKSAQEKAEATGHNTEELTAAIKHAEAQREYWKTEIIRAKEFKKTEAARVEALKKLTKDESRKKAAQQNLEREKQKLQKARSKAQEAFGKAKSAWASFMQNTNFNRYDAFKFAKVAKDTDDAFGVAGHAGCALRVGGNDYNYVTSNSETFLQLRAIMVDIRDIAYFYNSRGQLTRPHPNEIINRVNQSVMKANEYAEQASGTEWASEAHWAAATAREAAQIAQNLKNRKWYGNATY